MLIFRRPDVMNELSVYLRSLIEITSYRGTCMSMESMVNTQLLRAAAAVLPDGLPEVHHAHHVVINVFKVVPRGQADVRVS
jgi:hypothetical protein